MGGHAPLADDARQQACKHTGSLGKPKRPAVPHRGVPLAALLLPVSGDPPSPADTCLACVTGGSPRQGDNIYIPGKSQAGYFH